MNKLTGKTMVLLMAWLQSGLAVAQDQAEPDIENNIICYAAKSKWVCAPADDQAQAREKARKLALGETLEEEAGIDPELAMPQTTTGDRQRPISRQPGEDETLLSQISDFIPRSNTTQDTTETPAEPATQAAEAATQPASESVAEVRPLAQSAPITNTPDNNDPTPAISAVTGATGFATWQRLYPERWSFQVIGTSNRHKLNEFITRHQLNQWPFSIVKTEVNNADWWVVLVGLYDNREQALAQRQQLPAALAGPAWVRQVSTIVGEGE